MARAEPGVSTMVPGRRQVLRYYRRSRDAVLGSNNGKYFLRSRRPARRRRPDFATVKKLHIDSFYTDSSFDSHDFSPVFQIDTNFAPRRARRFD
jgi:hypothetical protein